MSLIKIKVTKNKLLPENQVWEDVLRYTTLEKFTDVSLGKTRESVNK